MLAQLFAWIDLICAYLALKEFVAFGEFARLTATLTMAN